MNKYEIFSKVVELGSLSHAAEVLSYSQSNITHIIQQLEKDYGFTLLIRNKAGVSLTENGRLVYEKIKAILAAEQDLQKCVQQINGYTIGSLRIGVFSSIAMELLPKALKQFALDYPHVEVTLYDGDHEAVLQWLLDGSIDIGFLSQVPAKDIDFIPLFKDEMLVILPENHPACQEISLPPEFFINEPTIYPYESIASDFNAVMKNFGVTPKKAMEVKGGETIVAMIKEGLGVSLLPELYMRSHKGGLVCLPVRPRQYRTIGAALPQKNPNAALSELFLKTLRQTLEQA